VPGTVATESESEIAKISTVPGTDTDDKGMASVRSAAQLHFNPLRLLPVILVVTALAVHAENPAARPDLFVDRAEELGVDFVHFAGVSGEFYIVEISGPGCGMLDYDNDGDLDLYLIQGHMLGPDKNIADADLPPQKGYPLRDRLYRNDLVVKADGTRVLSFTDVTEASGIRADGYGVGIAVADYDNDGWSDIFLTNFGPNQLWRNKGDGTFEELIARAGIADSRWNSGATFLDFDRDGLLDLFVGCYLDFSYSNHKICRLPSGIPGYCAPEAFSAVTNRLYRNRGDGTFEDRSLEAGVQHEAGKTLGVMATDFNLDGWMDVYVANDMLPNHMWINQRDGTFINDGLFGGTAVNADGRSESSMGVDAADIDDDGDEDLFMTHLGYQTNTLYINDGSGLFDDRTPTSGLGPPSVGRTSWGVRFFDYDNDGLLDLMTASGDVFVIEALVRKQDPFPMHQPNQLFRNTGSGKFEDVTAKAGSVFEISEVSRGLAFGDVDNDGDTDVLLENCNGRARLLINTAGNTNHWLGLRLVAGTPPTDQIGAWVGVNRKGNPVKWRRVRTDGSFASANDPRLLFGLGDGTTVDRVEVHWPDGTVEFWTEVGVDRYTTLTKGEGEQFKSEDPKP